MNTAPTIVTREHKLHLLTQMLRVRRMEEKCAELYSAEKIRGFLHLYIGEEAIAAGVMEVLRPQDSVVATYREHGHALLRGISLRAIMAEMYGKVTGCSRGRGGSMHLFDRETRFLGGNAIVAGGLPLSVGLALADKMQGRDAVSACFFGDGATEEGEFHEALNMASLWGLPVLFCCENNLYAMGTSVERSEIGRPIYEKAASYDIPSEEVDGMDVLAVERATRRALEHIGRDGRPYFLEFKTYRFRPHSMFDPELYRDKEEVAQWKQRDPVVVFADRIEKDGQLEPGDLERIEAAVQEEIDDAVNFAESSPLEDVDDLTRFVYSEVPR